MAEEEKNEETTEETPEAEAPEAEAPAEEPAVEATEPPAEASDEVAEDSGGDIPATPPQEEPQEILSAKELRKAKRSRHSGEARDTRSGEERAAERRETRAAKAASRRRYRARARERRGSERGEGTPPAESTPGSRKVRLGTVVSSKPDKTITVRVEITRRHRTYEKVIRRSNTVHVHDERNEANEGDTVRVIECRPMSRLKRWRLLEIVERAR